MSTTTTVLGVNEVKGPSGPQGELRVFEVAVQVTGTYVTAAKPNFNILTALQAAHFGVTAVSIKSVVVWRDRYDGTNRYTSVNSTIALSGTGNQTVTFEIDDTGTNGSGSHEIADASVVTGVYVFLAIGSITAE